MRILFIDDDSDLTFVLDYYLKKTEIEYEFAEDMETGIEKIKAFNPDIIVTDLFLPDGEASEIIGFLKRHNSEAKIFLMTSLDYSHKISDYRGKVEEVIFKPFKPEKLIEFIREKMEEGS